MIAYYITAHGYGHAGRSLEVVEALLEHTPVTVVSAVDSSLLRRRLGSRLVLRERAFDAGVVQLDSVRGDTAATLTQVQELIQRAPQLLDEEQDFLREAGVQLVAVDAPALPLRAAQLEGIPGLAVTSFGWDYIYSMFAEHDPAWESVCRWFREDYACATAFLRWPLSERMESIQHFEWIPLVARPGKARDLGPGPWVLLWFHALEMDPDLLRLLPFKFLCWPSLGWEGDNIVCPEPGSLDFSDAVASVDVILSKPGFGIISDCIANDKPLVYVPRDDFREAQLLEEGIQRYLRHARIPAAELYAGRWQSYLEQALQAPPAAETLPCAGSGEIARRILSYLTG